MNGLITTLPAGKLLLLEDIIANTVTYKIND